MCNGSMLVYSMNFPPLRQVRMELPPEHSVVRGPEDLNDCEYCRQRQHEHEREVPGRLAGEKSASREKEEEHSPYEFERAIH
jgi:hypothetical protein